MDMETTPETDKMLEVIRKELEKIVEKSEKEDEKPSSTQNPAQEVQNIKSMDLIEIVAKEENIAAKIESNEFAANDPFMTALHCDVKKMQLDLDKTYALFRTIGDKFSNIDFSGLDKRIKDLDLHMQASDIGEGDAKQPVSTHIRAMLDQSFRDKTLDKLTENVSRQFRSHPGEFGDIPEVSNFFQACTQLQHGIDDLKAQGRNAQGLCERLEKAAEEKYQRMEEINKILSQRDDKKPNT